MARRKALFDTLFGESGEIKEPETEPVDWGEIMSQPSTVTPVPPTPKKNRESATGPFTVEGERDFSRRWNRTVNLFRAHYGLPLFKEES